MVLMVNGSLTRGDFFQQKKLKTVEAGSCMVVEERLLQVQGFCSDGRAVRGIFLWGLEVKRVVVLFRGRGFAFCRPLFG